ncbi:hypothetical protein ACHAWF_007816 [Thalassiosira exigua]
MNFKQSIALLFAMSVPNKASPGLDTGIPVAEAVEVPSGEATYPAFGIEVSPTKVYDKKSEKYHDACEIKISPALFVRDFTGWMKQHQVGKTLRDWSGQVQWKEEVWRPMKDWAKLVKWKEEVVDPMKEGMEEVDWNEVRAEVKKGMDAVDWKQVRKDVKGVDWKEVHQQFNEATQDVDWKGALREVKQGLEEVDWEEFRREMRECQGIVGWENVKEDAQGHLSQATKLFNEMKDNAACEIDWANIKDKVKKEALPDNFESPKK